jgi:hypothetical protein
VASPVQTTSDFVLDTAEVMERLLDLEKRWGKDNLRVLMAYRCTFGGRVRSFETRIKMINEVFESLKSMQKELKCP